MGVIVMRLSLACANGSKSIMSRCWCIAGLYAEEATANGRQNRKLSVGSVGTRAPYSALALT